MKIGFTCSAFDLFHAGHICMLEEAKQHCDYLIVGLQTDPTIDRPQKNKPVQSVYERWVQLAACKYVDKIIPYATEKELMDILQSQHIDVRFVGEEYQDQDFTGKDLGINIHYNKRRHSFSSTELRGRVASLQPKTDGRVVPSQVRSLLPECAAREFIPKEGPGISYQIDPYGKRASDK